jgi:hypothetical protein
MQKKTTELLEESVRQIIKKTASYEKIRSIEKRHNNKVHFIPKEYRVFGGVLQSMNIQFGNFLELAIENIIRLNPKIKIMSEYSGKKPTIFI